jgi:hypothetical protein
MRHAKTIRAAVLGVFFTGASLTQTSAAPTDGGSRKVRAFKINGALRAPSQWSDRNALEKARARHVPRRPLSAEEIRKHALTAGFKPAEVKDLASSNTLVLDPAVPSVDKGALQGRLIARDNLALWQPDVPHPMSNWPTLPPVIELSPGGTLDVAFFGAPGKLCSVTLFGAVIAPAGSTPKIGVEGGPMPMVAELDHGAQDMLFFVQVPPDPSLWAVVSFKVLSPTSLLAVSKVQVDVLN